MAIVDNNKFSPFHRVRNTLLTLRWLFGFPLAPVNDAYIKFSFKARLEYAKYSLYFGVPILMLLYLNYVFMKAEKTRNPLTAAHTFFTKRGFSTLDVVVFMSIPMVSLLSGWVYLNSFRRRHEGINKISKYLTRLNRKIYVNPETPYCTLRQRRCHEICIPFILIWLVITLATLLYTGCWYIAIHDGRSEQELSQSERISSGVIMFIGWILIAYPSMAVSADFVVFYLFKETKLALDEFKLMIKLKRKLHRKVTSCQESISDEDKSKIDVIFTRYIL